MRRTVSGQILPHLPRIYRYHSHLEVWAKQPRFQLLAPIRNTFGDSARDRGEEAAVALSVTTRDNHINLLWTPASFGHPCPTLQKAYPGAESLLYPRKPFFNRWSVPQGMTIAQLKQHAVDFNWTLDEPKHGLADIDWFTRPGIARVGVEGITYGYIAGGNLHITSLDDFGNPYNMPGYTPDVDEHGYPGGTAVAPVSRDEVWVLYNVGETLYLRRWLRGAEPVQWVVARRDEWRWFDAGADGVRASHEAVGWSGTQWWDNTGFRVVARADGARLVSYQAGPGMAAMRTYQNGRISEPRPVMFADREYAFQYCRMTHMTGEIEGRHYAVVERGMENSDGKIGSWFTSLAYSQDGEIWTDWKVAGTGRIRGCLAVAQGQIFLITPGRAFVSPGVVGLGEPATFDLKRVRQWRLNSRNGGIASIGETELTYYEDDPIPVPGDELRRYIELNGSYDYLITTEEVDSVGPTRKHNESAIGIASRGPLKAGIVYSPPVDEIFASGECRHIEFELQTVVEKEGRFNREEGIQYTENGHVLTTSKMPYRIEKHPDPDYPEVNIEVEAPTGAPAIAILPQPLRPGNFWASVRLVYWHDYAGLVFAYEDPELDPDLDNDTPASYWCLRFEAGVEVSHLVVYKVTEGHLSEVRRVAFDVNVSVAEFAVNYQNGFLEIWVSQPSNLPPYKDAPESLWGAHTKNLEVNGCGWTILDRFEVIDLPTKPTYVGLLSSAVGQKFRNLRMVEVDTVVTMGRLVESIGKRSGMEITRVEDLHIPKDSSLPISYTGLGRWQAEGAWYRILGPWMLETRQSGFDIECDINLGEGEGLSMVLGATTSRPNLWGVGGLELVFEPNAIRLRRPWNREDPPGHIVPQVREVDFRLLPTPLGTSHVRVVLYPDATDPSRSYLFVYMDGAWVWTVAISYATSGGYFGMNGSGRFKDLKILALPYFIGDHVWSYRRSAADEIKTLTRSFNQTLIEESDGSVTLCSIEYSAGAIGDLPSTMEMKTQDLVEVEASVIRVVGAEIYATWADPRLMALVGHRLMEIDVPYLLTEKQCLDYARYIADRIYAETTKRGAAGALDPRVRIQSLYDTLDSDGATRGYLVDSFSMSVNEIRKPHAEIRVELRRAEP